MRIQLVGKEKLVYNTQLLKISATEIVLYHTIDHAKQSIICSWNILE